MQSYYVYTLIDPRDNKVFYVGKGINSRVMNHAEEAKKICGTLKLDLINDIWNSGNEVRYEIFAQNLTEKESFDIECVTIDYFRRLFPDKMTNIQSGHDCIWNKPMEMLEDIQNNAEDFEEFVDDKKLLIIKANKSFDYDEDYETRYNKFRIGWKLNISRARKIDYLCVVSSQNIIKYVYKNVKFTEYFGDLPIIKYSFDGELDENNILKNKKCNIKFPQKGWVYKNT